MTDGSLGITISDISDALDLRPHQTKYLLRRLGVTPTRLAGMTGLYPASTIEVVRRAKIDRLRRARARSQLVVDVPVPASVPNLREQIT